SRAANGWYVCCTSGRSTSRSRPWDFVLLGAAFSPLVVAELISTSRQFIAQPSHNKVQVPVRCARRPNDQSAAAYSQAAADAETMPKWAGMVFPDQGVPGALARTMSAHVASSSHALLQALESADIEQVRDVWQRTERGLKRSALLVASYEGRHALRTPLMCAVQTANFAIFTTIIRAFDSLFTADKAARAKEMREQLLERDRDGWTVAIHAARSRHVIVLERIISEIHESGATEALTAKDHQQMTLLMHAAAAGSAAGFQAVVKAMDSVLSEDEMAEHMALRSGDDQTLLMIAAASSDKMSFKTCVEALRLALTPHDFRVLMKARDADGMTFLMHAANPRTNHPSSDQRYDTKNPAYRAVGSSNVHAPGWSDGFGRPRSAQPTTQRPRGSQPYISFSEGASPAPATRGPASEAVLRRHSLQKAAALGPNEERAPAGDDADDSSLGESRGGQHGKSTQRHDHRAAPPADAPHDPGDVDEYYGLDQTNRLPTSSSFPQRFPQQHDAGISAGMQREQQQPQ
ncbi:unnamed protein product, partial [Scytosiphon promiscuus]